MRMQRIGMPHAHQGDLPSAANFDTRVLDVPNLTSSEALSQDVLDDNLFWTSGDNPVPIRFDRALGVRRRDVDDFPRPI